MPEREKATGDLGLVQSFVNTLDVIPGTEELRDPNTLQAWLVANGLMEPARAVDEAPPAPASISSRSGASMPLYQGLG